MIKVKGSTKRGQQLIKSGKKCCWSSLHNLYNSWSSAKENAFNWCRQQYINDSNATAFGIGNANTFGFSASWNTVVDGHPCMRLETKDNTYIIFYDL